ncbi:alpha/beta hydrolase [Micromonospora sp. KLBMP9576]|uniref:alpha/beta hydrolase n=1 Tax=Micromonospora sp. KLBMP9576 TaxID=3424769 RepID=UPI003D90A8C6
MRISEGVVRYGPSPWQRVDTYLADEDRSGPPVVLLHGGFWRHDRTARDLEPLAVELVRRGCRIAVVEYRPTWDGGMWPAAVHDCVAALEALAAPDGTWRDAVVAGHSAGGHLAMAAVAGRGEGRRMVLLAPVVHLDRAATLGVGDGAVEHFLAGHLAGGGSSTAAVPVVTRADVAALTVIEAGCDQAVPAELMEHQLNRWRRDGLDPVHHRVPGARHMHLVNPDRAGCAQSLVALVPEGGTAAEGTA